MVDSSLFLGPDTVTVYDSCVCLVATQRKICLYTHSMLVFRFHSFRDSAPGLKLPNGSGIQFYSAGDGQSQTISRLSTSSGLPNGPLSAM